MVRAGRGGEKVDEFRERGVVALGDEKLGKLAPETTKADLLRLYAEHYPEEKEASRGVWASQFLRFLSDLQVGDGVMTYDPDRRAYLLGTIRSPYEWAPGAVSGMPHVRRVEWTHEVLRSAIGITARNSLGAIQTLFKVPHEAAEELQAKKSPIGTAAPSEPGAKAGKKPAEDAAGLATLREEVVEKADGFIEDVISGLAWGDVQDLMAGILRAMGYRTTVSGPGSDRGVDISASPDGLMLQEPRIFVEVKHRTGTTMGSKEIRAFLGGRKPGDRCLYVSTGGFSKDAHYEADRAAVPITLINLQGLRKLLVENYDRLDPDTRALVPMKKFYWPVVEG